MIMITAQIITVVLFLPTLLSLLLSVSPIAAASSPPFSSLFDQEQAKAIRAVSQTSSDDDRHDHDVRYEMFYIKNTTPLFLRAPTRSLTAIIESSEMPKKMETNKLVRKKIKIKVKNSSSPSTNARPSFSVMLPKGFVPPSGSSPCHNGNPNSVVFFCSKVKP